MGRFDIIIKYLEWLNRVSERAIYRGHANFDWKVSPSAFRQGASGLVVANQLRRWRIAAGRFATPTPLNDFEWMVLAQHYGIATPLLDWTTNPLTALFFACDGGDKTAGCVLAIERSAFEIFHKPASIDPFKERLIPALVNSSAMNARTIAQDSMMSVHSASAPVMSDADCEKFVIAANKKSATLFALRSIGFTKERMFADLTTLANEFRSDLEADHVFGFDRDSEDRDEHIPDTINVEATR